MHIKSENSYHHIIYWTIHMYTYVNFTLFDILWIFDDITSHVGDYILIGLYAFVGCLFSIVSLCFWTFSS